MPKNKRLRRRRNRRKRTGNTNRGLPDVIAPTHMCHNKYTSQVIGLTGASNHASQLYYINSVYHPEGTGTDTSNAIGYTELITLYESWQVKSAEVTLTIVCEEAFEILVSMAPSLVSLSLSTAALVTQLGELPYGKTTILSRNSGMNRSTMRIKMNLSKLIGNREFYSGYSGWIGGTAARPSNLIYFYFAVASLSGDNLTNGVTFMLTIDYRVLWSGRIFNDILGFNRLQPDTGSIVRLRPGNNQPISNDDF